MSLNLRIPEGEKKSDNPKILIFGVGGAGCNAIDNMITAGLDGVDFVAVNADSQALANSKAPRKIRIGGDLTKGLGAGSYSAIGRAAAIISKDEITECLEGCDMLFITAGMGGGTGTGASPVIAKLAKDKGILVVSVVAKPFDFEGAQRMRNAESGIKRLRKYSDTLIVIPNQNLFRVSNSNTTFENAFQKADAVLHAGVRSITDLITLPGLINLDFADIRAIMGKMGKAMMGTGEATGPNRAIMAAEAAICNPLLDNVSIKGARGILINITGGPDMTLFEVDESTRRISSEVDPNANIIFGSAFNKDMNGRMKISVVATGIDSEEIEEIDESYEEDFTFDREQVEALLKKESFVNDKTKNVAVGLHEESKVEKKDDLINVASLFSNIKPVANSLEAQDSVEEATYKEETIVLPDNGNGDFFDFGNAVNPDYADNIPEDLHLRTGSNIVGINATQRNKEQHAKQTPGTAHAAEYKETTKFTQVHYTAKVETDLAEAKQEMTEQAIDSFEQTSTNERKETKTAAPKPIEKRRVVTERRIPDDRSEVAKHYSSTKTSRKGGLFAFMNGLVSSPKKDSKEANGDDTANLLQLASGEQPASSKQKMPPVSAHNDNGIFDQEGNIIINDEVNNVPAILRRKKNTTAEAGQTASEE